MRGKKASEVWFSEQAGATQHEMLLPGFWRAGFPYATAGLVFITVVVYFLLSGGVLYATGEALGPISFRFTHPLTAITHMFAHVGAIHLVGNIVPLVVFALILETVLLPYEVFAIFFASGVVAALVFGILNPHSALIGASAAVAGLVGAAVLTKPKWSVPTLLVLPLAMGYVVMPAAQVLVTKHATQLTEEKQALQQTITTLLEQNRTAEVVELNKTLAATKKKAEVVVKGIKMEQKTPTEIPVHFYGFFIGIAYVLAFNRREVERGGEELLALKDAAEKFFKKIKKRG